MSTLMFLFLIGCYMTPTGIACVRAHNNSVAIAVLNVLLGWTLIGWVAALVWSATNDVDDRRHAQDRWIRKP